MKSFACICGSCVCFLAFDGTHVAAIQLLRLLNHFHHRRPPKQRMALWPTSGSPLSLCYSFCADGAVSCDGDHRYAAIVNGSDHAYCASCCYDGYDCDFFSNESDYFDFCLLRVIGPQNQ